MEFICPHSKEQKERHLARIPQLVSSRAKSILGVLIPSIGFLYSIFSFGLVRDSPQDSEEELEESIASQKPVMLEKTRGCQPGTQLLHKSWSLKPIKTHQGQRFWNAIYNSKRMGWLLQASKNVRYLAKTNHSSQLKHFRWKLYVSEVRSQASACRKVTEFYKGRKTPKGTSTTNLWVNETTGSHHSEKSF